eukprot:GHVS01080857.1.p1 GENE.GHVS01080857.1~~GHVS01080857.1.p1  ORF type:complete len:509 (+),score=74.70 GHVS01080857.1:45-1571(+)
MSSTDSTSSAALLADGNTSWNYGINKQGTLKQHYVDGIIETSDNGITSGNGNGNGNGSGVPPAPVFCRAALSSFSQALPSALLVTTTHILMLLSMALYAGNYVFFRLFNEHGHSAFLFSLLRTLLSVPFIPLVYYLDPKNSSSKLNTETTTTALSSCHIESVVADTSQSHHPPPPAARSVTSLNSFESRESFVREGSSPDHLSGQHSSMLETTTADVGFLANMTVNRKARAGLAVAALSGAIRQMIVPVALMFTSAANAGLIQPTVPVFTSFLAVLLGLETAGVITCISIILAAFGLLIAGRAWDVYNIDKGFLILLLVPVSKGLQVIGLQFASKHERSSVLQIYQIIGLIAFIVPVATFSELAFYSHWSFSTMIRFVGELDVISWAAVVYSAVSIILICWRIQILGVKVIGSVGVALYQAFQPVFAFILGHFVLGEPLFIMQAVGAVIVCFALGVYQVGQVQQRQREKDDIARELEAQTIYQGGQLMSAADQQQQEQQQLNQSLLGK